MAAGACQVGGAVGRQPSPWGGLGRAGGITARLAGQDEGMVDEDLREMTREQLIAEARRLRAGIRAHRDSSGHALCWHHPALWGLLPEKTDPLPTVPTWPEFLRGCLRNTASLWIGNCLMRPAAPVNKNESSWALAHPRSMKIS